MTEHYFYIFVSYGFTFTLLTVHVFLALRKWSDLKKIKHEIINNKFSS